MGSQKLKELSSTMKTGIVTHPQLKAAQQWYSQKSQQDQLIIRVVGVLVALSLVFLLIIKPAYTAKAQAHAKLTTAISTHTWLKEKGPLLSSNGASTSQDSILATVSSSAKQMGIDLKRFEPSADNGLRIWLDDIAFDKAIEWLSLLHAQGIDIAQINADRQPGVGFVNLRADLKQ